MVKHLYIPLDDDDYQFLTTFKGSKTWKELLKEIVEMIDVESRIYEHAEFIKLMASRFIEDKEKREQIIELAEKIQKLVK